MKIKLMLAYKGTNYSGWQVQKNANTVQKNIQDAIETVFGKRYSVSGCSRTDSGVHANCFCCAVSLGENIAKIPEAKIPFALNKCLPKDISILSASYVSDSFHPRYDVIYKEYEYLIWNRRIRDPFMYDKTYHYSRKLDVELMNKAAQYFVGEHDFAAFMSSGSDIEKTVRNIKYFTVSRKGDIVKINVAADGFLYNMVRIMVGTLIEISEGKIDLNELPYIIADKKRARAGFTAQPQGLYLNKIVY